MGWGWVGLGGWGGMRWCGMAWRGVGRVAWKHDIDSAKKSYENYWE